QFPAQTVPRGSPGRLRTDQARQATCRRRGHDPAGRRGSARCPFDFNLFGPATALIRNAGYRWRVSRRGLRRVAMAGKSGKAKKSTTRSKVRTRARTRGRTRARTKAYGRRHGGGARRTKRWSQRVTRTSDALDLESGVFTLRSPHAIALSLKRSALASQRRKTNPYRSALSMLTFYVN